MGEPLPEDIAGAMQAQMQQQAQATIFARDVLRWLTDHPDQMQLFHEDLCVKADAGWKLRGKTPPTYDLTVSNLGFTFEVLNQVVESLFDMGILQDEPPNDPMLS